MDFPNYEFEESYNDTQDPALKDSRLLKDYGGICHGPLKPHKLLAIKFWQKYYKIVMPFLPYFSRNSLERNTTITQNWPFMAIKISQVFCDNFFFDTIDIPLKYIDYIIFSENCYGSFKNIWK